MISHSLGAMPRRVHERLREYADTWSLRGIRAWEEGWWEMPVTVGDLVGRIIGACPGEVVMQQNVSTCVATVLSCFDSGHGTRSYPTPPTFLRIFTNVMLSRNSAPGW